MRVETVMTEDPVWVDVTSSIGEVIEKLLEADVRHLPVLDDGVLVGIVSDRDLRSIAASVLTNTDPTGTGLAEPISMIMTSEVFTTTPDSDVKDVVDLIIEHRIGAVPVVDPGSGKLAGIVSYVDVLRVVRTSLWG
jgi:acetoin utilization protein AcuB